MTSSDPAELRGRSLAGADLASAHLAGSDVRGTDFTGADLHDADLRRIRSGMSRAWTAILVISSLVLSVGVGVLIGSCARALQTLYAGGDVRREMAALFIVAALLVFLIAGIWKGLHYAITHVLPVAAALAVAGGLGAIASGAGTGIIALLTAVFVAFAAVLVTFAVLVRAIAGATGRGFFVLVAMSGAIAAGVVGGGTLGTVVAIATMLMARRSARFEEEYPSLAHFTKALACRGGTHFNRADLHGAHLEHAHLFACDFRGANLDGAHLDGTTMRMCLHDPVPLPPAAETIDLVRARDARSRRPSP
ncbi:MAG: pentapeptide repeat-containing protein [Deltaproteobacteria bacterium]|nr:pentapeptide repeat-containing protein [Deltaproteobacteria bacterium]MCW5801361.1 pentapeptide repeat-containing protein [Deltaproteobacteria bacterium]